MKKEKCPICNKKTLIPDMWGGKCTNCKWYPRHMPYDDEDIKQWKKDLRYN